jgi:signal transduction histidine kinase
VGVELNTSAAAGGPGTGRDAWDRLSPLWHLFVAGSLALPTVLALTSGKLSPGEPAVVLGLLAVLALWHWFLLLRNPKWQDNYAPAVVYWVGAAVVVALLTGYSDAYTIALYGFYPLAFLTLMWWGLVPVVVLAGLAAYQLDLFSNSPAGVVNVLTNACLALVVAVVVHSVARQSEERRDALDALAATRAELADTARRAGVLEERQRLARELHDTVAQGFTSIVTHLEAADQAVRTRPDVARAHLDTARRTARDGLGELRRSVQALRPDLLVGASLAQALRRTAERWTADNGVPAQVRVTGEPVVLHPDTEAALLRITQEALTNTARHARATRAVVTLSYLGDTVSLDVDDDGAGFAGTPEVREDGGFGLVAMRERIVAVGGRLDVESAPGEGTTIAATVPA